MPQVASETLVQSHSPAPARAASPRSSQASRAASPFESLIDDPAPPPARDREPSTQAARRDKAEAPADTRPEANPAKSAQEAAKDRPAQADGAGRSDGKSENKSESKSAGQSEAKAGDEAGEADGAAKPADTAKPGGTTELDPLPADGKEGGKPDNAGTDETADAEGKDKPAEASVENATPAVPDPAAAQAAPQPGAASAPAQAPANAAAAVTAAAETAKSTTKFAAKSADKTADKTAIDGSDNASPKAKTPPNALPGHANTGGPAAKLSAQAEQAAQNVSQEQTPKTDEPSAKTAKAEPAAEPEPDSKRTIADQRTARAEQPANAPRLALSEATGNAAPNTQSTAAQPANNNAVQNITLPHPASQTAPQTAASAAAPQTPSQPVPPAGLAVAIAARASAGKNDFSIRLDPPELGRVDVRLSVDKDGQVTSHLVADRKDTLALLQRDASGLQRALQDAGFKTADNGLQFSLRDSFTGQEQQQQQQQQSHGGTAGHIVLDDESHAGETIAKGYGRMLGRVGGVDIRV